MRGECPHGLDQLERLGAAGGLGPIERALRLRQQHIRVRRRQLLGYLVAMDPTNGFRVMSGATTKLQATAAGTLSLVESALTLDNSGIRITPSASFTEPRAYTFVDAFSGGTRPGLYYREGASTNDLYLQNITGATTGSVFLGGTSAAGYTSYMLTGFDASGSHIELGAKDTISVYNNSGGITEKFRFALGTTGVLSPGSAGGSDLGSASLPWGGIYWSSPTTTGAAYPVVDAGGALKDKTNGTLGNIVIGSCTIGVEYGLIVSHTGC